MENSHHQLSVRNAGLVIFQSYTKLLFERLGLLQNETFKDEDARLAATHHLHYVATGLDTSMDFDLTLNKVLCGLDVSQPIEYGITISEQQKTLMDGMITGAIEYWPAIGSCSVNGFRGNWLVRNGLLTEHETKWELNVERRAYDVLIHKAPFSFSIIRFPWMTKSLHVTWSY